MFPYAYHYALVAVLAYLIGSINFSLIISKIVLNKDIRKYGSGNAGATNSLRVLGKKWAAVVAIGDFAKGAGAVLMGNGIIWGLAEFGFHVDDNAGYWGMTVAAFAVIIGHAFPVYFGFRGGKSAFSTAGVLLVIDWRTFLCCMSLFIVIVVITRFVSLGSMISVAAMPVCLLLWQLPLQHVIIGAGLAVIVISLHHENIARLIRGAERKIKL
jgi:glycerol-3-phosphate acyltransferase PlsY